VVYTPKNMTPYELQRDAIAGYMRFYSMRVWLKYLFTFRFAGLVFQTWGQSIVRAWRKDERNKDYLTALKRLHLPPAGTLAKPHGAASPSGER
jgi:hypothetical protein